MLKADVESLQALHPAKAAMPVGQPLASDGAERLILVVAFGANSFLPISTAPSLPVLAFAFALALFTGVLFGSAPDPKPIYAGLGPGFVGLYQFDLTVPKLADGDYVMSFQVGSVKAVQNLLFTVKN